MGAGSARTIGLAERARAARAGGADLLVSVHHDSVQPHYLRGWTTEGTFRRYSDAFRGYSIFYTSRGPTARRSLAFAEQLGDALLARGLRPSLHHAEDIPGERRRLVDPERGIYDVGFTILASAEMPALLFEAGVIVNRDEEELLASRAYRARITEAIVDAVERMRRPPGR